MMEMLEARFMLSTYYVSNGAGASDANTGLDIAHPWATAAKVNAAAFVAGDNILFERGGNWHEKLIASSSGNVGNPITYGDYGNAAAAKPTFWGSDVIAPNAFVLQSGLTYQFPTSAVPGGNPQYIFANHQFMTYKTDLNGVNNTANSFTISGATVYVNTGGSNPASGGVTYTASDRVTGGALDSGLICSNAKNNLVFNNLIGRETAETPNGSGDAPDGYVFRLMGSSGIVMNNDEAYNGGKHHFGVINTTGFVGTGLYANGVTPNLTFGHASAFVSFAENVGSNFTSQWINSKVENMGTGQQSFYTHGNSMGPVLVQNLQSIGVGFAAGQDNASAILTVKGGFVSGGEVQIFGNNNLIDGMTLGNDNVKFDLFGNSNTVQNIIDTGSTNGEGGIVVRGNNNVVRFNTLAHSNSGSSIDVKGGATGTQIFGNIFTKTTNAVNLEGGSTATFNYNLWDSTVGATPAVLSGTANLLTGDPKFNNPASSDYTIKTGSPAIDSVPTAGISGITTDALGNPRPAGSSFDRGAYEFVQNGNAVPIIDTFTATPSPVTVPNPITLTATAHDTDGSIASISFFKESNNVPGLQTGAGGDQLLNTDSTSPYTFNVDTTGWTNGLYTFYAQATDNAAAVSSAASANVTVQGGVAGNTYYVSPTGDDAATGTDTAHPWKTVAKVNATALTPGATVLFARGGEWHEALRPTASGTAGNLITFGAYGTATLAKPTFWGSDVINNASLASAGGNVYTIAANAINPTGNPTGIVNWVYANHVALTKVTSVGLVGSTANSWFLNSGTLYINSGGTNPATNGVVYTAASRQDVIFNNYKDYVAFNSLIGRETGEPSQGYVIRIESSIGNTLTNCEAYDGGVHNIGVINSTGFVGTGNLATGALPGQNYGNSAFVSYSDGGHPGSTSQWIDSKVFNFVGQPAFYAFGDGMSSLSLKNFVSLGSEMAISTAPGETVSVLGGMIENQSLQLYGSNITVDGMIVHGDAGRIQSQGANNIIQNCVLFQTSQDGAIYVFGGATNNIVRFNTFNMLSYAGATIRFDAGTNSAIGNVLSGSPNMIKLNGGSLTSNNNFFDTTAGTPVFINGGNQTLAQWQGTGKDANSLSGDAKFVSVAGGNFSLASGSPAIDKVPTAGISNIPKDITGQNRLVAATYDMGAYEFGNVAPASISGNVYSDFNTNGTKDGGENAIQNWTVYVDVNNNAVADAGEPTAVTDLSGNYAIMNLTAGTQFVKQVIKPTWRKTEPVQGTPGYNQVVAAGNAITGKNFGNTHQGLAFGTVFNDLNGNGVKDAGENGLVGWRVYNDANNNNAYDVGELSLITDATGGYRASLPVGTYRGRVEPQGGLVPSVPASGFYLQAFAQGDIFGNANFGFKSPGPAPAPAPALAAASSGIISGSYDGLDFFSEDATA